MPLITDTLPQSLKSIHIMGIAGTAMGSLAGMLKDAGYTVTGSDKAVYPPMSTYLEGLEIPVMEGFKAANLDHKPDLVVVGNVVRAIYEEAATLVESELNYCSFPQLLGHLFLKEAHSVVVAGTHGKTTTTALTAWLLEYAGVKPGFLIGGVPGNFDRTARAGCGSHFVIEGDEYDTAFFDKGPKFLHYRPRTAILTSIEFDHADIYRDLDHVKESFQKLVGIMPADGCLIAKWDDENVRAVAANAACRVWRYGPGQEWDGRIESVNTTKGTMRFSVLRSQSVVGTFESTMVGDHNLYNQVAAVAAAVSAGIDPTTLKGALSEFKGIKRRQEVIGEPGGMTIIDDFAHHPTAVKLTLESLRLRFGERRLWAIWEPRSATSRRNTFQNQYAESFGAADKVIIAKPYDQSGIPEEERFSEAKLVKDLCDRQIDASTLSTTSQIVAALAAQTQPNDVVAILSNGGFDGLHGNLLAALQTRFPQ